MTETKSLDKKSFPHSQNFNCISKGLFIVVLFTQHIMSTFQQKTQFAKIEQASELESDMAIILELIRPEIL